MSTVQEVLNKLYKLKDQAAKAPDFLSLEKVSTKVDKIRSKVANHRSNKQLMMIMDKIDQLVREKNKYFRQIMINSSKKLITENKSYRNQEAQKTLKHSKSAQNFKGISSRKTVEGLKKSTAPDSKSFIHSHQGYDLDEMSSKTNKQKSLNLRNAQNRQQDEQLVHTDSITQIHTTQNGSKNIKNSYLKANNAISIRNNVQENDGDDGNETLVRQINKMNKSGNIQRKKLIGQIDLLQQKLGYSFKKIDDLNRKVQQLQTSQKPKQRQQHLSPMTKTYVSKQQTLVQQYSQKLREKSFIIQDLKAKLQYFKSMNDQLKNKIINQQRRNQDYVDGLKQQLKKQKKQIQRYKKQNEDMKVQIQDLEEKNQGLMGQVKKLVMKLEQEAKDKDNVRKSLSASASSRIKQLQQQISKLTSQSLNLSKLQVKLQHQQQQKQQIMDYKVKLQSRITQLQLQSKKYEQQRNKIQLQLYKQEQETKIFKSELKVHIQAKQLLADELLQTKERLEEQLRANSLIEYEGQLKAKNKLNKLKEIKGLLTQLQ